MVSVYFGPCKLQVDDCTCGTKWETPCHEVDLCACQHHSNLDTTKETAAKLLEEIGVEGSIEEYLGVEEKEVSSDFYV